jgi:hypothetical protein
MSTADGLLQLSFDYLWESLRGAVVITFILGIICFPVIGPFASSKPLLAVYAGLGVVGWGVHFGQRLALDRMNRIDSDYGSDREDSILTQFLLAAVAGIYYNSVIFLSTTIAYSLELAGMPVIAVLAGFIYPSYDSEMARRSVPLSFGGIAAFVMLVLNILIERLGWVKGVSWASLGLDQITLDIGNVFSSERLNARRH